MTTPYWSDFVPNSTFYRILSGFHRTFETGVVCRQGTLTPPDTWSRPFGTCICSTCWDQSFSELVVVLPDFDLRISLGTFSILLEDTYMTPKSKDICVILFSIWVWSMKCVQTDGQADGRGITIGLPHPRLRALINDILAILKICQYSKDSYFWKETHNIFA